MTDSLPAEPEGRVNIAFDDTTTEWAPTWTCLDATYPNLIASYTIDRGRQYELDRTDVGRATVSISDVDGILDPTNVDGPYHNKIEPLLQIALGRWNPVTDTWHTRFRGFIEEMDYVFDPSQKVNRLVLTCVDFFEILAAIQLIPGYFGVTPPTASLDGIYYAPTDVQSRIREILGNCGLPTEFAVVFTGNVNVKGVIHSLGETALSVIQECADAEFPGVSNVYVDRFGRLAFHGRLAKFDPATTHEGATPGSWDWHQWSAGDAAAVAADFTGDTAQIRTFASNRGLAKVINSATATPLRSQKPLTGPEMLAQHVQDATSLAKFGYRSWSALDLIVDSCILDDADDLTETKRFASFYVDNYKVPRNRITAFGLRSIMPADSRAAAVWKMLSLVDISDTVTVSVASPGGGGFADDIFFVEGIHEQVLPLGVEYDDVTLSLDLSPQTYYTVNPFPVPDEA